MGERSLDEIRDRVKEGFTLTLREWKRLIEEGDERDLRLVIDHLYASDFVSSEKWGKEVDGAYAYIDGLKARALSRIRDEFKPKPAQDFKEFFNKLKEILDEIKNEEIRREIEEWGCSRIKWKKPGSLIGGFLSIFYRWNTSLEKLSGLSPRMKKELEEKISFPYTGFLKNSSKDQYIDGEIRPGGLITPTIPVSPEELAQEINRLIEEAYLPSDYSLEIKEFLSRITTLSSSESEKVKKFLREENFL